MPPRPISRSSTKSPSRRLPAAGAPAPCRVLVSSTVPLIGAQPAAPCVAKRDDRPDHGIAAIPAGLRAVSSRRLAASIAIEMPPLYTIRTRARPACRLQQGSALIWALFFVAVTAGLLITNSWEMQANRTAMDVRYRKSAHARMIAQSALTDATAWFQRQSAQPVTTFAPKLDPEADPPLNETVDPTVGLVREFEVRGGLWARYEVRKDECLDVSSSYGETAGKVWDVGARGILFE